MTSSMHSKQAMISSSQNRVKILFLLLNLQINDFDGCAAASHESTFTCAGVCVFRINDDK